MKEFLASRGVGGALGGWGAPLAVAQALPCRGGGIRHHPLITLS